MSTSDHRAQDWNDHYLAGEMPWESGLPDPLLVAALGSGDLPAPPARALEIGCGTGINARVLAAAGYDVLAIDGAPAAIERAAAQPSPARFAAVDFLAEPLPDGPFDLIFDRGCFHVFDDREDQVRFATRVSELLRPGGVWLSLIGSTEGAPRETGPPRRSARDLAEAIEPLLEIVVLRRAAFAVDAQAPPAWYCLTRRRTEPANPSTRHSR